MEGQISGKRLIIEEEGCEINKIIEVLNPKESVLLVQKWRLIALALKIPVATQCKLKFQFGIEIICIEEVYWSLLEEWKSMTGQNALLVDFVAILRNNSLNDAADAIVQRFYPSTITAVHVSVINPSIQRPKIEKATPCLSANNLVEVVRYPQTNEQCQKTNAMSTGIPKAGMSAGFAKRKISPRKPKKTSQTRKNGRSITIVR